MTNGVNINFGNALLLDPLSHYLNQYRVIITAINLRVITQGIPMISIPDMSVKITNLTFLWRLVNWSRLCHNRLLIFHSSYVTVLHYCHDVIMRNSHTLHWLFVGLLQWCLSRKLYLNCNKPAYALKILKMRWYICARSRIDITYPT